MLGTKVGECVPDSTLMCIRADDAEARCVRLSEYAGRWLMLVFYPRDFTFVCPTELTAFSARMTDFRQRGCELLGISVDSIEMHQEWLQTPPSQGGLGPLQFPLASDPDGALARAFGVWIAEKEVSTRGLFLIDPDGILQYAVVHNLSVGRSPDEVLRVLDALRTGGLCPASWTSADGTLDPETALQPGRILGHYRIRKTLGAGTFGSVFAALDLRLERMVALKVLRQKIFESRDAVLAEARSAARLSHPNVCTVYAVDEEDGLPVIVMEHLDGVPLSQVIAEGLERNRALRLASQVAAGLANAHQNEVVHGDLKPANVIITSNDVVKIVDFGLARSQQTPSIGRTNTETERMQPLCSETQVSSDDTDVTIVYTDPELPDSDGGSDNGSVIRGTPAYMSPEHARGLPVTPASDVYCFGLMLFEMLTGKPAISEKTSLHWILKLRTDDLAPELVSQVDESYRELLTALLARVPEDRPTMSQVAQNLAAFSL